MPLSEALDKFLKYMTYRRAASDLTVLTYRLIIQDFIQFIGDIDTSELNVRCIDAFAEALTLRDYQPKTYKSKLATIRSFVKYMWIQDLCMVKPEQVELPPEVAKEANFMDKSEARRFIDAITDVRDRALFLTMITSGVRVSELCDLRFQDLYERSLVVRKGKGNKPRVVFITPEAEMAIQEYLEIRGTMEGYLFPSPIQGGTTINRKLDYGKSLSRAIVARMVRQYATKAGLTKRVTAHTLRHTMATSMLRNGARVEDVQQILGHNSIKTTMLYLHFTNDQLKKSYDRAMVQGEGFEPPKAQAKRFTVSRV